MPSLFSIVVSLAVGLSGALPVLVPGGTAAAQAIQVETVARGLARPWGLAFLPDRRMLVTERGGRMRIVSPDGKISAPLSGVPRVATGGQGGLLDVVLHPNFSASRLVYFSFSEPGEGGAGTAVGRGRLSADASGLEGTEVIFRQAPKVSGGNHFGSRLAFAPNGTLFVTLGDRFNYRDRAQSLDNHIGKVVRINADGSVPKDNPFVGRKGVRPEIWSYGHRNVQGAAIEPGSGRLWTIEHGARGGDEINRPEAGKNYGWPVITYGVDYSGARIGEGTSRPGMEQPVFYWDPSIAPSGAAFYTGDLIPQWKGNLFTGGLAARLLSRLEIAGGRVVREERLLQDLRERIRDVRQGPDGALYLLTDSNDGRILRLAPK